mgnify:CR=1 FL=1
MSTATLAHKRPLSLSYYIHTAVCLIIMFGVGQLPPLAPLTPLGMNLVGIFLGVLYGWIFIEIVWPSLAGLLAMMLIGGMTPVKLLNNSFGHPIVQMMFFIFVFCATISHYGLSKFISLWFITRKFVAGRPWVFTYTFLGSIFILGGLTSASPAAIIGWSILYGVCEVCGFKKGDGYPTMMVFGIVFAAQVGMSLIPFKQAALTVFSAYETMSGVGIDYAKYMLIALLICAVCSLLFIVMGKYIFRPDMSKLVHLDVSKLDKDGSLVLSRVQKVILAFLFLLVILLLAPNFMPKDFFLTRFLKGIGNTGIVILLVTVMAAIKVEGKALLNFKVMVDSGVTWGIVLLLAFVQPLSGAMAKPESGITSFLMMALDPIISGGTPLTFALFLGLLGHVAPTHHQGDAPLLAPLDHEVLVPLGLLPPQLMVEVGGVEGEGLGFGQGLQHGEQGHGICAPGQGAEDGAPLGEHIILVGKSRRLGGQVNRVLHNYAPQRRRQ